MTQPTTFGDFLRDARLAANLTQAALAARSGAHVNMIGRYEAGTTSPSAETAERLVAALGLEGEAREQLLSYALPESQTQTISRVLAALDALHQQLSEVEGRLARLEHQASRPRRRA